MVDTEENEQPLEANLQDFSDGLAQLTELIQPVLEKLFYAAQTDSDLWLKKKEVKILTDWQLIQAQQIDTMQRMMEQQPSKRLWQPGI